MLQYLMKDIHLKPEKKVAILQQIKTFYLNKFLQRIVLYQRFYHDKR